jgi:hypothetical protein
MNASVNVPHTGWSMRRRVCIAMALIAAFLTALLIAPGRAAAEASISVEVEAVPPVYWLGDNEWLITVTNPGTEPLTSVVLDLSDPLSVIDPATLTGPIVVIGNTDDVLDPGERWSYGARQNPLIHPSDEGTVTVSATAPDTTSVTATATHRSGPLDPVEITMTPDKTTVTAGETVTWEVLTRNLTTNDLRLPPEGDLFVPVDGRILFPDWQGPIPRASLGDPIQKGTDGDDTFGPGETWTWRYSADLTIDGSFLNVEVTVYHAESQAIWGQSSDSGPISVAAAPEPPPSEDLPETGANGQLARIALLLLAVGSTLLVVGRGSRTLI